MAVLHAAVAGSILTLTSGTILKQEHLCQLQK